MQNSDNRFVAVLTFLRLRRQSYTVQSHFDANQNAYLPHTCKQCRSTCREMQARSPVMRCTCKKCIIRGINYQIARFVGTNLNDVYLTIS